MADSTPPPTSSPAPAAPAKSGNRTLIIILCVLGGLFLLIGGCVTTCVYYGAKKAREYAHSAEKNPAYATVSLLASLSPDVTIVSKDEAAGKITLRNKKSGETITLDTHDYTPDNIGRALEKFSRGLPTAAVTPPAPAPAPDAANQDASSAIVLTINIASDGAILYQGVSAPAEALPALVGSTVGTGREVSVVIVTEANAPQPSVNAVMDICRKEGVKNIQVQTR